MIRVEVVYARREGADSVTVQLPAGATVRDALAAAGFATQHRDVGVYGKRVRADAPLADGDRVEIYRPLLLDPKERRRQRAGKARSPLTRGRR
ncbi:MAG TPA: RnfH family protein [Burkholderiales bacterium]|nr:RnfH family protein [Burkholderiales bacterium]